MFAKDEQIFQSSSKWRICDKLFDVRDNKVKDQCHLRGWYRDFAHWSCNINLKLTKKELSGIFHNLMSYDSHTILQEISKSYVKVNVIPNELEKYMAFTINNNLVFIDSMQFMNSSLDALVNNLSDNDFKFLSQEFSGDLLELVKQKGVYPYENMDSFKKFSEDKLPDRCKLFRSLKDECIEKDYSHTINVSNTFKINAMDDYHDLHLKTDVMLLAVFEKFISTCLEYYGLDPCHCFSSLPYSGFKRLNQKQIDQFDVNSIGENSSIGYIYKKLTLIILMNYMNCIMIIH